MQDFAFMTPHRARSECPAKSGFYGHADALEGMKDHVEEKYHAQLEQAWHAR